ncbi:tyrosine-type recombinase/integrase [Aneurinibacillus sp. UBA3580]|uniref:tyrosine-type recombinase/integrase n=1 Tax=Aneurinibacillus sp. UBA3580 TaxID=1946041 RepID=UPI00257B8E8B|nr:tyrosine-type recombinase/integrase [Aneurinibacillus sp. UBA3580]
MGRRFIGERGVTATSKDRRPTHVQRIDTRYTLDDALDIFVRAKEAEGMRPRTLADYRRHMEFFKRYLPSDITYIDEITPSLIRDYITYLRKEHRAYEGVEGREKTEKGLSITTINIRLRTMKTMFNFWHNEGMTESNAMATIKQLRNDEAKEVEGLSDEELRRVLESYNERYFAEWRDKTLILLLLDTGMRINEALTLTVQQIDFKQLSLYIPSEIAKNRKEREIPLSREVAKKVKELYEETRQYFGDTDYIFMNAYGEPMSPDTFRRRLNRLKNKLKMPKLHPHMFRHTFARNYILNGGDLFTLQKILDHSDITTTRKYIQMDTEHIRNQHNKYSPVKKILMRTR